MARQSNRHSGNSNLHLHYEDTFRGLPVMTVYVPFITEYLQRLYETTQLALSDHRQLFAVRFDLRFPDNYLPSASGSAVISSFVDSLAGRIKEARERAKRLNGSAHQTSVRWCWVRGSDKKAGRITTSSCCSTEMRSIRWDVFNLKERIYTAAFKPHGPMR